MTTNVRISINRKIQEILETLYQEYPALDDAELFKLGLSTLAKNLNNTSRVKKSSQAKKDLANFLENYKNQKLNLSDEALKYTDFNEYRKNNYHYKKYGK